MKTGSFISTGTELCAFIDGKSYTVDATHKNYKQVLEALMVADFERAKLLLNSVERIKIFCDGKIAVNGYTGSLTYKGKEIHSVLVTRILDMYYAGNDITAMVEFLENLMDNPSDRAVTELYSFLEYSEMSLTLDGCFIAYKRVNDNYTSCYDGKTDNTPGLTVSMPRDEVDDNSCCTCSTGLHVCSKEYLKHYAVGKKVILVKVNPKDVVSIPVDYNNTKMRVCSYTVIGELTPEQVSLIELNKIDPVAEVYVWDEKSQDDDSVERDEFFEDDDGENLYVDDEYDFHSLLQVRPFTEKEIEILDGVDVDETPFVQSDYVLGYKQGYSDGRHHYRSGDHIVDNQDDYDKGYAAGYKDGVGHKVKLYK